MKNKLIRAFFIAVMVLITPLAAFAHSGRTDGQGGHYNRTTGEYHYHHGYPAHQHEDGQCPYNFDDQTDHGSTGRNNDGENSKSNNDTEEKSVLQIIFEIIAYVIVFGYIAWVVFYLIATLFSR